MKKRYYNAETLDHAVREFEREYGMASEEFYERRQAEETIMGVPRFVQHVWAGFWEDILRMTDGAGVERPPVIERAGEALVCP